MEPNHCMGANCRFRHEHLGGNGVAEYFNPIVIIVSRDIGRIGDCRLPEG